MTPRLNALLSRWLLPASTGALLALALPPFNISQLAWIALIPLFFALQNCRRGEAFRRGYIAGLVFFGMTTWWIVCITAAGTPIIAAWAAAISLIAWLALYFGAWAMMFVMVTGLLP